MLQHLRAIYRLGLKELISLRYDPLMLFLIAYFFTFAVYSPAKDAPMELRHASVAIVDGDGSQLSKRIRDSLLPPFFLPPGTLSADEIDAAMDAGRYSFVVDIPPELEADVVAGRQPAIQLNVDATAMVQAGHGASYIENVVSREVAAFVERHHVRAEEPVRLIVRAKFNPNLDAGWFLGVSQMVNNISLVAILLTGAALIREREQGTIEHLLVMPLRPAEILLAKVWASGLVIIIATLLCLRVVLHWGLDVPIAGSVPLFIFGTVLYLFSMTAIGVFLATVARSMPQFGLLAIPIFIIINLLSGGNTPLDSMPETLQAIMQMSPSTHFVSFAQAILFRGASLAVVWRELGAFTLIGAAFFAGALLRFRETITVSQA
jgi:ABC-2 type transport system permease protein